MVTHHEEFRLEIVKAKPEKCPLTTLLIQEPQEDGPYHYVGSSLMVKLTEGSEEHRHFAHLADRELGVLIILDLSFL